MDMLHGPLCEFEALTSLPLLKDASRLLVSYYDFYEYHDGSSLMRSYEKLEAPNKPPLPEYSCMSDQLIAQWLMFHSQIQFEATKRFIKPTFDSLTRCDVDVGNLDLALNRRLLQARMIRSKTKSRPSLAAVKEYIQYNPRPDRGSQSLCC